MTTSLNQPLTNQSAYAQMIAHHAALQRHLGEHSRALHEGVNSPGTPFESRRDTLVTFILDEILPHARVEEAVLYAKALEEQDSAFIDAMVLDHDYLAERTQTLAKAKDRFEAIAVAQAIYDVFALHVSKENDILLPRLLESTKANLAGLLQLMHDGLDTAGDTAESTDDDGVLDVRALPHGKGRHEAIFGRLAGLTVGQSLVIRNDHDPKPLHYQLDAAWPGRYGWDYVESGPQLWQIAITRVA
jgi:uncharacterized protein (DUF2249 family)